MDKLQAFIDDMNSVALRHNVTLDKFVSEDRTEHDYFFKLWPGDESVHLETLFPPVYHGPQPPPKVRA